jgi:hypothetical protein
MDRSMIVPARIDMLVTPMFADETELDPESAT